MNYWGSKDEFIQPPERQSFSAEIKRTCQREGIPERELHSLKASSYFDQVTRSLILQVDRQFYERMTRTENGGTVKVPIYRTRTKIVPASLFDAIKMKAMTYIRSLQFWMKEIRMDDPYIHWTPVTDFERWLLNFSIPFRLERFQFTEKTGEREFHQTVNHYHVCPHVSPKSADRDCFFFLAAKSDESRELETLRAAVSLYKDIADEMKKDPYFEHYILVSHNSYRGHYLISQLEKVLNRG